MAELPLVDRKCDALRQEKQSHHDPNQAARHDAKFIPKSKVFFLPAKPDEPHPLVERAAYFLLVVRHTLSSLKLLDWHSYSDGSFSFVNLRFSINTTAAAISAGIVHQRPKPISQTSRGTPRRSPAHSKARH